jgi:malonate transporter and related proteins
MFASAPLIWTAVIRLISPAIGSELLLSIERIFAILGQAAAPLALVTIGLFLGRPPGCQAAGYRSRPKPRKIDAIPAKRLVVNALHFPLEPLRAMMVVLIAGMPVGANAFVIAGHYYGLRLGDASAAIICSIESLL